MKVGCSTLDRFSNICLCPSSLRVKTCWFPGIFLLNSLQEKVIHCGNCLAHWSRATHICVGKLTTIGSDGRRQAIIWTNAGILSIGPLGTNLNEILIEIYTFLFKKMHLKIVSAKWQPFCLSLNVLSSAVNSLWPNDVIYGIIELGHHWFR